MDVLATGYPSLDVIVRVAHLPPPGATARVLAPPGPPEFGGCGINAAAALARLGFRTGFAGVFGDDAAGRAYRARLDALGVDATHVELTPGQPTSHSTLYVDPQGRSLNFFLGGAADAWAGTLDLSDAAGAACALLTVGPLAYNRQFVREIQRLGIPLVWMLKADVHAYPPEALRAFLDASAYVLMNEAEAPLLLRAAGVESAAALAARGLRAVATTHGAAGADVATADGTQHVPAIPVEAVDPTGAGDAFAAGFVAGLLRGVDLTACARLGAAVASFVVEAVGCQTNLPGWAAALARCEGEQ